MPSPHSSSPPLPHPSRHDLFPFLTLFFFSFFFLVRFFYFFSIFFCCCAVEGPSGSGKTTLLDLLGGRKTRSAGRQEGDIIVDGVLGSGGGASSAYVMQVRGLAPWRGVAWCCLVRRGGWSLHKMRVFGVKCDLMPPLLLLLLLVWCFLGASLASSL